MFTAESRRFAARTCGALGRLLHALSSSAEPLSVDEITRQLYPEVTGFRAVLAVTDVGSRVEYLHQRGRIAVANLDDVEADKRAVMSVSGGVKAPDYPSTVRVSRTT